MSHTGQREGQGEHNLDTKCPDIGLALLSYPDKKEERKYKEREDQRKDGANWFCGKNPLLEKVRTKSSQYCILEKRKKRILFRTAITG